MSSLRIEPHYLGSLEYYALVTQQASLLLEVEDRFRKQTFRNRCHFLGANGIHCLVVPVRYSSQTPYKEVLIDHQQRWVKDHWGAFYSAYGKAPFFEYFADALKAVWDKKHHFLLDLSIDFLELTFRFLQVDVKMTLTQNFDEKPDLDFKDQIVPKKPYGDRKIYHSTPYTQLFGSSFVPNLSIIDLIMNEGPRAKDVLAASFLRQDVSTQ